MLRNGDVPGSVRYLEWWWQLLSTRIESACESDERVDLGDFLQGSRRRYLEVLQPALELLLLVVGRPDGRAVGACRAAFFFEHRLSDC